MKKIIFILVISVIFFSSHAMACSISTVSFGDNTQDTISKYGLNKSDSNPDGYNEIIIRGEKLCDDLPVETFVKFVFLYDKFVQVKIERDDSVDTLLPFLEKYFGRIEGKPDVLTMIKEGYRYSWNLDDYRSTSYSLQKEDEVLKEYFDITSKTYGYLFDKMLQEDEKQ